MPFHIFIQTIFKPQLPKCPNVFMSLLSAQPEIWSSWFVVTIEMSQTISHFHFTASHVVSDSLWFNCVKQFLNCSTAVLSLQRDNSERDINFKSVCLITLSHYCEKYSSLQLRRLSVCVEQLLPNDNNPSCCIIGKKLRNRCRRKFYLNSNPRNLKIRRVGRSQLPTQAYLTFVYEFTANCEKKPF